MQVLNMLNAQIVFNLVTTCAIKALYFTLRYIIGIVRGLVWFNMIILEYRLSYTLDLHCPFTASIHSVHGSPVLLRHLSKSPSLI